MKLSFVLFIITTILLMDKFNVVEKIINSEQIKPTVTVSTNAEKQVQEIENLSEEEIKNLVSQEFSLLEEAKEIEEDQERLDKVRQFVDSENEKLKSTKMLTFGEYDTYITNTFTIDGKNTKTLGATFNVAYGVDLSRSYYSIDEEAKVLTLNVFKDDVKLAHCMKNGGVDELADDKSFLNAIGVYWQVSKREELKEKAIEELEKVAVAKVQKTFDELEPMATVALKDVVFSAVEILNDLEIFNVKTEIIWR